MYLLYLIFILKTKKNKISKKELTLFYKKIILTCSLIIITFIFCSILYFNKIKKNEIDNDASLLTNNSKNKENFSNNSSNIKTLNANTTDDSHTNILLESETTQRTTILNEEQEEFKKLVETKKKIVLSESETTERTNILTEEQEEFEKLSSESETTQRTKFLKDKKKELAKSLETKNNIILLKNFYKLLKENSKIISERKIYSNKKEYNITITKNYISFFHIFERQNVHSYVTHYNLILRMRLIEPVNTHLPFGFVNLKYSENFWSNEQESQYALLSKPNAQQVENYNKALHRNNKLNFNYCFKFNDKLLKINFIIDSYNDKIITLFYEIFQPENFTINNATNFVINKESSLSHDSIYLKQHFYNHQAIITYYFYHNNKPFYLQTINYNYDNYPSGSNQHQIIFILNNIKNTISFNNQKKILAINNNRNINNDYHTILSPIIELYFTNQINQSRTAQIYDICKSIESII